MNSKEILKKIDKEPRYQITFFCIIMILLVCMYSFAKETLERRFEIIEDNFSWTYQIDSVEIKNEQLVVSGWAFELGQDANHNFEIVLNDLDTGKGLYPEITYELREDVNHYFKCENDYTASGFVAQIPIRKLATDGAGYEILLRPNKERLVYSMNTYYVNGEILFSNPEFVPSLGNICSELQTMIDKGILKTFYPDKGAYVYQYENDLYWIIEKRLYPENEWYMQLHMDTTQVNRLENDMTWSKLTFSFEEKEIAAWETDTIKVAKYELPREYSITRIWTGYHDGEWVWRSDFRPRYDFAE